MDNSGDVDGNIEVGMKSEIKSALPACVQYEDVGIVEISSLKHIYCSSSASLG